MESENESGPTPEEYMLKAFEVFETDSLDIQSLVNIAMAANCPSTWTAIRTISNLVDVGVLTYDIDKHGMAWFTINKPDDKKIN